MVTVQSGRMQKRSTMSPGNWRYAYTNSTQSIAILVILMYRTIVQFIELYRTIVQFIELLYSL